MNTSTSSYLLADRISLVGRGALVTGASRGIGAAIARTLDAAGARVAVTGRSREDLERVAASLNDPIVLPTDLSRPEAAAELAEAAITGLGRVDVLINNAGQSAGGPTGDLSAAVVDELFAVNVRQALILAGRLAAHTGDHGGGSIVTIASTLGVFGIPGSAVYGATKAALVAATRSLAAEWGAHGVRVNAVSPGVVETDMSAIWTRDPEVLADYNRQVPLGRVGQVGDVADVVAFLASPAAAYVNAQNIVVDGGFTTSRNPTTR